VKYDLSHLTQPDEQAVFGPIQDDEALFLYAAIRGLRVKTVFEVGGLHGYSAENFLKAVGDDGLVFTCDFEPVPKRAKNHVVIQKDAAALTAADLRNKKIELVFFDCHDYEVQMAVFDRLLKKKLIDDETILALHDTNLHPAHIIVHAYELPGGGWVHQPAERRMVNEFAARGYHAFSLHPKLDKHSKRFPFRHGLTLMQKYRPLSL
jgi:predicted O-methyltransferase YrrM